jgi:hypothetical protein
MTQLEIEYVKKLKEYIEYQKRLIFGICARIPIEEGASIKKDRQRYEQEIAELGKQCQFEILCDPVIFEAGQTI